MRDQVLSKFPNTYLAHLHNARISTAASGSRVEGVNRVQMCAHPVNYAVVVAAAARGSESELVGCETQLL